MPTNVVIENDEMWFCTFLSPQFVVCVFFLVGWLYMCILSVKLMHFIVYIFCPFQLTSKLQSLKYAHNFESFFFVCHKFMCLLNYFMA